MNVRKATRRAAHHSLDGHIRFVVALGRVVEVLDVSGVATRGARGDIIAAYSRGKCISPRSH